MRCTPVSVASVRLEADLDVTSGRRTVRISARKNRVDVVFPRFTDAFSLYRKLAPVRRRVGLAQLSGWLKAADLRAHVIIGQAVVARLGYGMAPEIHFLKLLRSALFTAAVRDGGG